MNLFGWCGGFPAGFCLDLWLGWAGLLDLHVSHIFRFFGLGVRVRRFDGEDAVGGDRGDDVFAVVAFWEDVAALERARDESLLVFALLVDGLDVDGVVDGLHGDLLWREVLDVQEHLEAVFVDRSLLAAIESGSGGAQQRLEHGRRAEGTARVQQIAWAEVEAVVDVVENTVQVVTANARHFDLYESVCSLKLNRRLEKCSQCSHFHQFV